MQRHWIALDTATKSSSTACSVGSYFLAPQCSLSNQNDLRLGTHGLGNWMQNRIQDYSWAPREHNAG